MAKHLLEEGRSLCGQANEAGSGEPCRSCERSRARREREAAEAAVRREYFEQFRPGVFVAVTCRNQRMAGTYVVAEVYPARESMDLIARTGREVSAHRLGGGSFEIYHRAGGSQGCWVASVCWVPRSPETIRADLKRAERGSYKRDGFKRGSLGRMRYLRLELEAAAGTSAGAGRPGRNQED